MQSQWTLIITVFISLAFMLMMAPSIIQLNRGKAMRNIILWLALFVALGAIYKFFGPEGEFPLIHNSNSIMSDELKEKRDNEGKVAPKQPESSEKPVLTPRNDGKDLIIDPKEPILGSN